MNPTQATAATRFKVGIFTVLGLVLIGAVTVFVNDRPFWWRPCQLVHINVEDATGLKSKSPIKSLGIEIGYLNSVELSETYVTLGICITAPVEVLPTTRAFIRSEGFLGDKFVELKPVKYTGSPQSQAGQSGRKILKTALDLLLPSALAIEEVHAADPSKKSQREIPVGEGSQDVQHLVNRVDNLVHEITGLTNNLRQAINPDELRSTMRQLNKTLENASKTLAPEGGLNQTAQRTLAKLEDAIEQLRDMLTRVNKGEGSLGSLINDPSYAEEIKQALKNLNKMLNRASGFQFIVDVGGEKINGYGPGRGWFRLGVWPNKERYYLLGASVDPRGRRTATTTTTNAGGVSTVTQTVQIEETGLLITAMLGKVFFRRLDLSVGALHGDGALSVKFLFGPTGYEDRLSVSNDLYARVGGSGVDDRLVAQFRPWGPAYVRGGFESFRKVNGQTQFLYGAGITFDDEDIKFIFAFL